jgi:hypothetical protein
MKVFDSLFDFIHLSILRLFLILRVCYFCMLPRNLAIRTKRNARSVFDMHRNTMTIVCSGAVDGIQSPYVAA